jgi:predicted restriction endonuclease
VRPCKRRFGQGEAGAGAADVRQARRKAQERGAVHIGDPIERRYVVRLVKQRIHQAQFRGAVLPAYRDRCAICTLKEIRLLDAAHIVADAHEQGEPLVSNGLSLCSIHHRAFDEDLVGISPDREVHVSRLYSTTRTARCSRC